MNTLYRDLLISQILRGETLIPSEVTTATPSSDPDTYVIQLIDRADRGESLESLTQATGAGILAHPDHRMLGLFLQVLESATLDGDIHLRAYLAILRSDEMRLLIEDTAVIRRLQDA